MEIDHHPSTFAIHKATSHNSLSILHQHQQQSSTSNTVGVVQSAPTPSMNNTFYGVSSKWITSEFYSKCEEAMNRAKKRSQPNASSSSSLSGMGGWFTACMPLLKSSRSTKSVNNQTQNNNGNNNNMVNNNNNSSNSNSNINNSSNNHAFPHGNGLANGEAIISNGDISIKNVIDNVVFSLTNGTRLSIAEQLLMSNETKHLVKAKADYYISYSSEQSLRTLIESIDDTIIQSQSKDKYLNGNDKNDDDAYVYIDFLCQNQWTINDVSPDKMQQFYSITLPNAIENIGRFILLLDQIECSTSEVSSKNDSKQSEELNLKAKALNTATGTSSSRESHSSSSSSLVDASSLEVKVSTCFATVLKSRKCLWELYCAASARHKNSDYLFKLSHRTEKHKKMIVEYVYTFPEALLKDLSRMIRYEKSTSANEIEAALYNQVLASYSINASQVNQAVLLIVTRYMADICHLMLYKLETNDKKHNGNGDSMENDSTMEASTAMSSADPESISHTNDTNNKSKNTNNNNIIIANPVTVNQNQPILKSQKRKMLLCSALSFLFDKLDEPKSAEKFSRRLVHETEKAYGPLVRHTAIAWHSLAHFLAKRNKKDYIAEALVYYKKSLDYCKAYGEDERVPVILNDMALCEKLLGTPDRSIPLYLEALSYWQNKGKDTTEIATCMSNLANSYTACGNLAEALRYHTQSLQVIERLLGPNHPQCAKRLIRIAKIQHVLGAQSLGNELAQRALQIYQQALGPNSPEYLRMQATVIKELQQPTITPSTAMEMS